MLMVFGILLIVFTIFILTFIGYLFHIYSVKNYNIKSKFISSTFIYRNIKLYLISIAIIISILFNFSTTYLLIIVALYYCFKFSSRFSYINYLESSMLSYPIYLYDNYFKQFEIEKVLQISLMLLIKNNIKIIFLTLSKIAKAPYEDIKLLISLKDYNAVEGEGISEKYFQYQKSYFKYAKPQYMKLKVVGTPEEILELKNAIKFNKDTRKPINMVRRLPWMFEYSLAQVYEINWLKKNILPFYTFFKTTILALVATSLYFLYTIFFFKIQFLKQLSVWFIIGMLFFWLISGFNFFFKRYRYGKFTSAIQRFWKRTNACFWMIEGFLILIFFYYFLNSSQEPMYMYDYSGLNQEYLISLHTISTNIILLSLIIYFMYYTLLRLNSNNWPQLSLYLIILSVFIFYSFFIETYQFYYVISTFNERLWTFNEEENLWSIEVDSPILRTKQQYFLVCLIAKYWHFLFIFLSWVFFLMKSYERRSVNYVNFGVNLQNIVILYALNLMCYVQWAKWVYRRFLDLPYTWFFTNIDNKFIFRLFSELKLLVMNLFNKNNTLYSYETVLYKSLELWNVDSLTIWKYL